MRITLLVSAILFALFASGRSKSDGGNLEQCVTAANLADGVYPWTVAIYDVKRSHQYICGGTLISDQAVLTAAHCVFEESRDVLREPGDFQLAVGKSKSSLEPAEPHQQLRQVKRIVKPDWYTGMKTNYRDDIALIELKDKVDLGKSVRPACLDPNFTLIPPGTNGTVVGFGLDNQGKMSEGLTAIKFRTVDRDTCVKEAPQNFIRFMTSEKYCASTRGGDGGLSHGFGGSGLVFDVSGKLYLGGVTSLKPREESSIFLATAVAKHSDWLRNALQ